ncbi:hypothetical protein M3P05_04505 [Sansalvadorimonas sp. 2012CJ34-2]|uniref:Uncharacterized protein n=1 Tax=Parendozoicomonas callyspongiae TaxID=2942213 RepID=A0ABT0PCW1_9GAMM|nr:hypothetical protein [Sansalvadorimonas sp. 2012CJ34-2]MCL6269205.1 hypothetical protein [Sansalvadorimonas sp. 2012CJ34-2]
MTVDIGLVMASNSGISGLSTSYPSTVPTSSVVTTTSTVTTTTRDGRRAAKQLKALQKKVLANPNDTPGCVAITDTSPTHSSGSSDDDFPIAPPPSKRAAFSTQPTTTYLSSTPPRTSRTRTPVQYERRYATRPPAPNLKKASTSIGIQVSTETERNQHDIDERQAKERESTERLLRIAELETQLQGMQSQIQNLTQDALQSRFQQYAINEYEQELLILKLTQQLICDDTNNFAEAMALLPCNHAADASHWVQCHPRYYRCQSYGCHARLQTEATVKKRDQVIRELVPLVLARQAGFFEEPHRIDVIQEFCVKVYMCTDPLPDKGVRWFTLRKQCIQKIKQAVTEAATELNEKIREHLDQDH